MADGSSGQGVSLEEAMDRAGQSLQNSSNNAQAVAIAANIPEAANVLAAHSRPTSPVGRSSPGGGESPPAPNINLSLLRPPSPRLNETFNRTFNGQSFAFYNAENYPDAESTQLPEDLRPIVEQLSYPTPPPERFVNRDLSHLAQLRVNLIEQCDGPRSVESFIAFQRIVDEHGVGVRRYWRKFLPPQPPWFVAEVVGRYAAAHPTYYSGLRPATPPPCPLAWPPQRPPSPSGSLSPPGPRTPPPRLPTPPRSPPAVGAFCRVLAQRNNNERAPRVEDEHVPQHEEYVSFSSPNADPFDNMMITCPACGHDCHLKAIFAYGGINARPPLEQMIKSRAMLLGTGDVHPFERSNPFYQFGNEPPEFSCAMPSPERAVPMDLAGAEFDEFAGFGQFQIEDDLDGDAPPPAALPPAIAAPAWAPAAPAQPPTEIESSRYHAFDRLSSACPYCHARLNLKIDFTYLGVNSMDTQEHEIKIGFQISLLG